jgi:hypothetical protein
MPAGSEAESSVPEGGGEVRYVLERWAMRGGACSWRRVIVADVVGVIRWSRNEEVFGMRRTSLDGAVSRSAYAIDNRARTNL